MANLWAISSNTDNHLEQLHGTTLPDATTHAYKQFFKEDTDALYVSNGVSWIQL